MNAPRPLPIQFSSIVHRYGLNIFSPIPQEMSAPDFSPHPLGTDFKAQSGYQCALVTVGHS